MITDYDDAGREIDIIEAWHRHQDLLERRAKRDALKHLMRALSAAGVYVQMEFDPDREKVIIRYLQNGKCGHEVNVHMDNAAAMLYDIFKQAGPELVAEA